MSDLKKYRKKPVVVEAILLTEDNLELVANITGGSVRGIKLPKNERVLEVWNKLHDSELRIEIGEYLVKGKTMGDYYPCNADVFAYSYEEINN